MSKRFCLCKEDMLKVGKGALIAVLGALLTYISSEITSVNFGELTPIVVAGWSILANLGRKWIVNNK
jgi:hypothetical protein